MRIVCGDYLREIFSRKIIAVSILFFDRCYLLSVRNDLNCHSQQKIFRVNWPLAFIQFFPVYIAVQKDAEHFICLISLFNDMSRRGAPSFHPFFICFSFLFITKHNKSKNKLRKIMSGIVLINQIYMANALITLDSHRLFDCGCVFVYK